MIKKRIGSGVEVMLDTENELFVLAGKEKDISAKMPLNESFIFFIEKLDSEPHVFKEILPLLFPE